MVLFLSLLSRSHLISHFSPFVLVFHFSSTFFLFAGEKKNNMYGLLSLVLTVYTL